MSLSESVVHSIRPSTLSSGKQFSMSSDYFSSALLIEKRTSIEMNGKLHIDIDMKNGVRIAAVHNDGTNKNDRQRRCRTHYQSELNV